MYKIFLVTTNFLEQYLIEDIKNIIGLKPNYVEENLFEIIFQDIQEFLDKTFKIIHFSRTIDFLFLEVKEFQNIEELKKEDLDLIKKEFAINVDSFDDSFSRKNLKKISDLILNLNQKLVLDSLNPELEFEIFQVNKNFHLCLNLFGSSLSKREYQVNVYEDSINPLLINYLLFKLEIQKTKKFSLIDPLAELGEVVIETALFNPRKPLFVKEKRSLPISKVFKAPVGIIENPNDNNKIIAVVQDNNTFKYLKENISFSSQKIKVSQYDFDWLDVKFHNGDFDYLITVLPEFDEIEEQKEYEKELFYQAEFITKNQICVFSKKELLLESLKEFKLEVKTHEKLFYEDETFNLYIIK